MIDIAATVLEAAGLPEPPSVNGVAQMPLHGVSMAYSFDDPDARERRETQYFEIFGNRGIYHHGWTAVTRHAPAMGSAPSGPRSTTTCGSSTTARRLDPSPRHRRRAPRQARTTCSALFLLEASKYGVFPLDDRVYERFNADIAGRPQLIRGNSQLLFGGMGRLTENSILMLKNKSHAVTAEIDVPRPARAA